MPFRTRPGQPRDLLALVESELRERIEDAVDHVSLDVMVQARRAHGLPAPAADSARDRKEFSAGVRKFLERLRTALLPGLAAERQRKADEALAGAGEDPIARLIGVQVMLAKELPDYWQRFEVVRGTYTSEQVESGRERSGLLRRVFRR
ncbi:MAG: hypothetical protein AUH29_09125 [Candidatus Rokubacteria bacterium 13_1_40CM_69_27]|nr:MAG: hypothetical protein AUH29_09125 [Candidatus Rokubacteria bacterium 13_1_40CM_69_27]